MNHSKYMLQAIQLAKKGTGQVSPNPRVGCIIVHQNHIIATGYHKYYGDHHAEVNAISAAPKHKLAESILYVNLEPCSHYGKTPPCVDLIIQSGIRHIVVGIEDPNPLVKGRGIKKLQENGVKIDIGIEKDKCVRLNEMFIESIQTKRPFVTLKAAQTLDGFIATTNRTSKWITGESSRKYVHQLRREHDAVLVGIDTLIHDNSLLTVRHGKKVQPKRIILDSQLRIPLNAKILNLKDITNTIIATTDLAPKEKIDNILNKGAQILKIKRNAEQHIDLDDLLKQLWHLNIASVFVEGGQQIFSGFLRNKLWDKYICFIAPKLFGEGLSPFTHLDITDPSQAIQFCHVEWHKRGQDIIFEGRRCSQD